MKKESPVDKFPGYVILPDFLTLPQVRSFEDAIGSPNFDPDQIDKNEKVWLSVNAERRLPVIFDVVEEWHIEGQPEEPDIDTFKMTPIVAANDLVQWLFGQIRDIWLGETEEDPN
jgi:hypothetical protein